MKDDARLQELARQLGSAQAEQLDVERLAASVVERLRRGEAEPRPTPQWLQPAWLRAAALVLLMLGVGIVAQHRTPEEPVHPAHFVADELQDLSTDQLRDVLRTLDQTIDGASDTPDIDDFNHMDTEELRAVLQSLEG